jgi:hypothetical protein
LAALERDPTWRRPEQHSLFDLAFTTAPKRRIVFALEPGSDRRSVGVSRTDAIKRLIPPAHTRPQEEKISADEAIGTTSPLKKSLFLLDAMV